MKRIFNITMFIMLFIMGIINVANAQETINHAVDYQVRPTILHQPILSSNEVANLISNIVPTSAGSWYTAESSFGFDGVGTITNYTGTNADLRIPPTIGGVQVINIRSNVFANHTELHNVVIPLGVTNIGVTLFRQCGEIRQVSIPSTVQNIGVFAFDMCTNLSSITIPEGVANIQGSAFALCTNLTSVWLPDTLSFIGSYAFGSCSALTTVRFPERVEPFGHGTQISIFAFQNCTSLSSIIIPAGVYDISSVFSGCTSLAYVYFRGNAPSANTHTFSNTGPAEVYIVTGASGFDNWVSNGYITAVGSWVDSPPYVLPNSAQAMADNASNGVLGVVTSIYETASAATTLGNNVSNGVLGVVTSIYATASYVNGASNNANAQYMHSYEIGNNNYGLTIIGADVDQLPVIIPLAHFDVSTLTLGGGGYVMSRVYAGTPLYYTNILDMNGFRSSYTATGGEDVVNYQTMTGYVGSVSNGVLGVVTSIYATVSSMNGISNGVLGVVTSIYATASSVNGLSNGVLGVVTSIYETASAATTLGNNVSNGVVTVITKANVIFSNNVTISSNLTVNGTVSNGSYSAIGVPVGIENTGSNVVSALTNYYRIVFSNFSQQVYLPLVPTNQSADFIFEVSWNDGTNSGSFVTNAFATVNLSTNPVFTLKTNGTTTAVFHKRAFTTYYTGWTLSDN